jgi:ketopantoate hydroxymethyltransferase
VKPNIVQQLRDGLVGPLTGQTPTEEHNATGLDAMAMAEDGETTFALEQVPETRAQAVTTSVSTPSLTQ